MDDVSGKVLLDIGNKLNPVISNKKGMVGTIYVRLPVVQNDGIDTEGKTKVVVGSEDIITEKIPIKKIGVYTEKPNRSELKQLLKKEERIKICTSYSNLNSFFMFVYSDEKDIKIIKSSKGEIKKK